MKVADVRVGNIYYVDYEPVLQNEFNGIHLSVILKKNNDKVTFIVMPLTSSPSGENINKIKIGNINALPIGTRHKVTYAVFNQIRTVNANRIIAIKDQGRYVDVTLDKTIFKSLFLFTMRDLMHDLNGDEKIEILKQMHNDECFNKAKNLAYDIIKLQRVGASEEIITAIKIAIRDTLKYVPYSLDSKQIADGLLEVFDESMSM